MTSVQLMTACLTALFGPPSAWFIANDLAEWGKEQNRSSKRESFH